MRLEYRTVAIGNGQVADCTDVFQDSGQSRLAGHLSEAQVMQTIAGKNQRAAQTRQTVS